MKIFFASLIGYLIGNIDFAIIVSKILYKKDIRDYGSKNPGATNTFRIFGIKPGIIVLTLDVMKSFLYLFFLKKKNILPYKFLLIVGLSLVLGHIFPLFFSFKGGKGVAVTFGILIAICPKSLLIVLPVFLFFLIVKKRVSLASVMSAFVMPFSVLLFIGEYKLYSFLCFTVISIIIIFSHRNNILKHNALIRTRF